MAFLRQWLLILLALGLGGGQIMAASGRENRAYAAAAAAFQDGMYGRAETVFAQFVEKYPKSERVGEAVLLQAQAEIKLGDFSNAVARLTNPDNLARAGRLGDAYGYWAGEAQFQGASYSDAAETWIALSKKFPTSGLRLQSVVAAASAFTELARWQQVAGLLEATNGVFANAAQTDPDNAQVARGKLLLAQSKYQLKNFPGAAAILEPLLDLPALQPAVRWRCGKLLYQVRLASGDAESALAVTTNLLQIAQIETNDDWRAESVTLRAGALETLGRTTEAIAAYQENLANAPADWQREAVLKVAGLAIAQNQFQVATNALETFRAQFPDSPAADVAALTLAEIRLKDYVAHAPATNQLAEVQAQFNQFIGTFTNSPLLGKAYLDRGWCNWEAENYTNSLADFQMAAQTMAARQLPPSEDLLVAWFKMGDAQLALGDFTSALENYRAVLDSLKLFPAANATLGDLALYQGLRASVKMNDMTDATNLMAQLLRNFPASPLAEDGALLVAEGQMDLTRPTNALALLESFKTTFTNSLLRPQVELAIARTCEREQDWPAAITNYENWLAVFPANELRPQAAYALAWANFQAGNETNAFGQFTNFVAQFPTNDLAPLAQMWVADHFFRAGDFVDAEKNYKYVFQNTNWQGSPLGNRTNLFYPAQMMAGRAAGARLDYNGAIRDYFSKLEADTNCPIDLRVQATFEHGFALMRSDSTDTNNPLANFGAATNEFIQIVQLYPTNELGALALFYIGECHGQLANYDAATNVYAQVFNSPSANNAARSQAQIAFGMALEKKAALASGASQNTLLDEALDNYLAVFNGLNLREDEQPDPFWLKKAGLQAAPLIGLLNDPKTERNFYVRLETKLPQLADSIDKKIAALPSAQN